ncbi:MAG: adenine phosphoribosyltransferase [Bacilli bacterium]|nr:adenine phosphoribosyltransferase [Bacilli bacterium]
MKLENYIRVVEGFPTKEISFKDISPLLADPLATHQMVAEFNEYVKEWKPDYVIGPESRGFVCGIPLAYEDHLGFIMARKKGKLPGKVISKSYTLEYGTATIELPENCLKKGDKVVLVDDLLATGGTLAALEDLIEEIGAEVVGILTVIELTDLKGAEQLKAPYASLIKYPH